MISKEEQKPNKKERCKVMLLGDSGSGKTFLLSKILKQTVDPKSTDLHHFSKKGDGYEIELREVPNDKKDNFQTKDQDVQVVVIDASKFSPPKISRKYRSNYEKKLARAQDRAAAEVGAGAGEEDRAAARKKARAIFRSKAAAEDEAEAVALASASEEFFSARVQPYLDYINKKIPKDKQNIILVVNKTPIKLETDSVFKKVQEYNDKDGIKVFPIPACPNFELSSKVDAIENEIKESLHTRSILDVNEEELCLYGLLDVGTKIEPSNKDADVEPFYDEDDDIESIYLNKSGNEEETTSHPKRSNHSFSLKVLMGVGNVSLVLLTCTLFIITVPSMLYSKDVLFRKNIEKRGKFYKFFGENKAPSTGVNQVIEQNDNIKEGEEDKKGPGSQA